MKSFVRFLSVFPLIVIFAFTPFLVSAAAAQTPHGTDVLVTIAPQAQEPEAEPMTLQDLLTTLETLGGVSLFFAALINVGKKAGKIQDGQAPAWSLGLNAAALVALVALQLTGKFDLVPLVDKDAGLLANAINAVLALTLQLYVARKGHENVLAGIPAIGKSYSGRRAGEPGAVEVNL